MAEFGFVIDTSRCMACYNCFMACKDEHCGFATPISAAQPHTGQFWMRIREWERGDDNRRVKTATVAIPCAHCKDAPCAAAAKDGAVYRRADGIVIIDPVKAKGQNAIVDACPLGAVFWNEELQLPQKCTFCAHLLDEGYSQPRCSEACPNGALIFGDLSDPRSAASLRLAAGRRTPLPELAGLTTKVIHLNIPTVFLAGSVYLPDDEAACGASVTLRAKGDSRTVSTNYFGDWEAEELIPNLTYEIMIGHEGYKTVHLQACTDSDHYVGETIMEKA